MLKNGAILVISAPLHWFRFYDDLSHVRPYYPNVFINYLCENRENRSRGCISNNYKVEKLVYRWRNHLTSDDDVFASEYFIVDVVIKALKKLLQKLGFKKYYKNGYTIILRKY